MPPTGLPRLAVRRLVLAVVLFALLLGAGFAVTTSSMTHADISFDQSVARHRTAALTTLAKVATALAQPTMGVVLAVVAAVLLYLLRRRYEAVAALAIMVGGLAVAFVVKYVVSEPRPPAQLQVIPPDSKWSFPSGHTVVAASIALALILLVRGRWRLPAALLGVAFTVWVASARVYLGVHYLPDVLGGCLSAVVAVGALAGLAALPAVSGRLAAFTGSSPSSSTGGRHRRGPGGGGGAPAAPTAGPQGGRQSAR